MGKDVAATGWQVTYEPRPWAATSEPSMSRRQRLQARGPYQAAVPARIATLQLQLLSYVEAESAEATAAIARFDAEVTAALPDVGDAEMAPLAAVLLRTESASSSQIENITAGSRALALADLDSRVGPNALLVARNVAAMRTAIELAERIDEGSVIAAQAALLADSAPGMTGGWRSEQVWIGGGGDSPHSAVFVPPHHDRVAQAMADLFAFCDRTDIAPLTQAAIAHAQFETIHPFPDGNGRVGRTLVHAILRRTGVTRRMTVPVSAGLLTDTRSYFAALDDYRAGDLASIVVRFSEAAHAAVTNGNALVGDLVRLQTQWRSGITARSDAAVWRVLGHLLRQPAVTVKTVREAVGVSQPAAQGAIDQLVAAGVLVPANDNRRDRIWVCPDVLGALDAFAERARRRR